MLKYINQQYARLQHITLIMVRSFSFPNIFIYSLNLINIAIPLRKIMLKLSPNLTPRFSILLHYFHCIKYLSILFIQMNELLLNFVFIVCNLSGFRILSKFAYIHPICNKPANLHKYQLLRFFTNEKFLIYTGISLQFKLSRCLSI